MKINTIVTYLRKYFKKTVAVILIGVFLVSDTFGWAANSDGSVLAPKLLSSDETKRADLWASLICELIENRARYGKTLHEVTISDIEKWEGGTDKEVDGCVFTKEKDKATGGVISVSIENPEKRLVVRYFDPAKAPDMTPYSDVEILSTFVISPDKLVRQIIYRTGRKSSLKDSAKDLIHNLWAWPLVCAVADDIKGKGITTNPNFVKTNEKVEGAGEESTKIGGIYEHTVTKLKVVLKTEGAHIDTENLPYCCPTFYSSAEEACHAELYLVPFGYRKLESLDKYHVTPDMVDMIRKVVSSTFHAGNPIFDKKTGLWHSGVGHGHLHGGNILVKLDRNGNLDDVKIIDWKKVGQAVIPDSIADLITGKRIKLAGVDLSDLGGRDSTGSIRYNGLDGLDIASFAKDCKRLDISYSRFERTWANWINLGDTVAVGCNFTGTVMIGVNLRNADLRYATITGNIRFADLRGADMRNSVLKVKKEYMQCAHFGGADLRGIDLETLDFSEAMLARTKFDLKYADKFIAEGYIVKRLADFCEVTDAEVKNEIILLGESGLLNSLRTLMMHYLDRSKEFLSYFFVKNSSNILLRIPVESIESLGKENIANFLGTLQQAKTSNAFVELFYMSDIRKGYVSGTDGSGEVSSAVYEKVGLKKVPLPPELKDPHKRTRKNTITLFPAYKGREEDQASIAMKIGGFEMTPTDTILSPIGLQNDATGLIRATILGLQMMELAQIIDGKDVTRAILDDVLVKILQRLKDICDPEAIDLVNLKPEDIVTLVTGAKDKIVQPLNKLINILPIKSFSAEELRQIYEHAKEIITAA